jgi:hypothetical protein
LVHEDLDLAWTSETDTDLQLPFLDLYCQLHMNVGEFTHLKTVLFTYSGAEQFLAMILKLGLRELLGAEADTMHLGSIRPE